MNNSLHVAFTVGLLLLLTKVADFIFLQKQKDTIEKYFKSFYLFIKVLNPNQWLSFLKKDNLRFILAIIGCLLLAAIIIYNFWIDIKFFWSLFKEVKYFRFFLWAAVAYGIKFINSLLGEYIWEDIPDWLIDTEISYRFILRYCILVLCYCIYYVLVYLIAYKCLESMNTFALIMTILLIILNCITLVFSLYILWVLVIFFPIFLLSLFWCFRFVYIL